MLNSPSRRLAKNPTRRRRFGTYTVGTATAVNGLQDAFVSAPDLVVKEGRKDERNYSQAICRRCRVCRHTREGL